MTEIWQNKKSTSGEASQAPQPIVSWVESFSLPLTPLHTHFLDKDFWVFYGFHLLYFGTSGRQCSQSTGNDVSGPLFSPFFPPSLSFSVLFSVVYVSFCMLFPIIQGCKFLAHDTFVQFCLYINRPD